MSFAGITSGIMYICASVFFLIASVSIALLVRYLIKEQVFRHALDHMGIIESKDDEEWPSAGSSD